MKVMKAVSLLCVLVIVAVPAQGVVVLPHSTYGQLNGWEGYRTYEEDGFDLTIIFNVYDIEDGQFTWKGNAEMPSTDRYIYAYQIINNSDSDDVGFFSILNLDGSDVAQELMHSTCSQEASMSDPGVMPDPDVSETQGEWVWSSGVGFLEPGTHSWFLIFSSDKAPVKGSFKVEAPEEGEVPIPEVPEPGTIALLGVASGVFVARRRRKRRAN